MAQARAPRVGTTPNAKKQKPSKQPGLLVGFDGDEWLFHTDAINPKDAADMRRATGLTTTDVFQAVADGNIPIDVFGALVFLARRQADGRWINFAGATEGLTIGSDCTITTDVDEETPNEGEA